MIGNDIVDLTRAAKESNWRRARFLDRVFTAEEQKLIPYSENKHQTVWRLWSLKEAAYKVYVQETGHQFFNPKKLHCELISTTEGIVKVFDRVYYTISEITESFIHSIAAAEANLQSLNHCFILEQKDHGFQSAAVRSALILKISKTENLAKTHLQVKTDPLGIPNLYCEGKRFSKSLSLSHHGAYGAFAMC